jgi:hypothetical protein
MEASSLTKTNGILALSAEAANDSCHSARNEDQSLLACMAGLPPTTATSVAPAACGAAPGEAGDEEGAVEQVQHGNVEFVEEIDCRPMDDTRARRMGWPPCPSAQMRTFITVVP